MWKSIGLLERFVKLEKKNQTCILACKQKNLNVPTDLKLKYAEIKNKCKVACKHTLNSWWKNSAKKAEEEFYINLKQGKGGSLIKKTEEVNEIKSQCL